MLADRAFQCQRAEGLTDSRRTDGRTDRTGRLTDRQMDERMGIWKDRHAGRLVETGTLWLGDVYFFYTGSPIRKSTLTLNVTWKLVEMASKGATCPVCLLIFTTRVLHFFCNVHIFLVYLIMFTSIPNTKCLAMLEKTSQCRQLRHTQTVFMFCFYFDCFEYWGRHWTLLAKENTDLRKPVTDIMSVTLWSQVVSVQSLQYHMLSRVTVTGFVALNSGRYDGFLFYVII